MAEFDISIDRVNKIPVPLLVVGLGGTGCDTLKTIKETFAERYILPTNGQGQEEAAPERTAYLGIDSRSERPEGLDVNEYVDITVPGLEQILKNQEQLLTPFERTWVNRELRSASTGIGMGTIRQAGRLALSRNYAKIQQAVHGALTNITSAIAGNPNPAVNRIEIVVVTGIGGGTGSGIFLDMAQILRNEARNFMTPHITGYIVMPDVSLANVTTAQGMQAPIRRNAYAALKELDFWMRVREHNTPYTMKYGPDEEAIAWSEPPFDCCILMSSTNVKGQPYQDGYQAMRATIAENLMHYMAQEDGVNAKYSYRQYEDNLSAMNVPKTYPLYYGYRAIGAFTKRIPKQSILYYEGLKLLNTFIPLRDNNGQLQPDRRMFLDGQGKMRADGITGSGRQLMQDFSVKICSLPTFCHIDLNDKVKVAAVQNLNPPPHMRWQSWRDQDSAPRALKAAEDYLQQAWARFEAFALDIIQDPEQGPFALEVYLEEAGGLLAELEKTLENWTSQKTKIYKSINESEEMCRNSWPGFRNPPLLSRRAALEQYDHAIRTLYTNVNNHQFLDKHVAALEKLLLRIREYLRDSLRPLCQTLLRLQKQFASQDKVDTMLVQDIYSLATVQDSIDDTFVKANANNKVSRGFLAEITKISMQTEPSVDGTTSGVTFLCRAVGQQSLCEAIQQLLEDTYGSVNDQSLDAIMHVQAGGDLQAQQGWMNNLAESAINSALPMFKQDAVFANEPLATYSYMSIPNNAPDHVDYIRSAFSTHTPAVEPKASTLTDHIYCLISQDKLPLYRYGLMEELRIQYDRDLGIPNNAGVHLVRNGDPEADYKSDWSLLPSSKPYFLFAKQGVPSEAAQYQRVKDLVSRGIACGVIEVDSEHPHASAQVFQYYTPDGGALLSEESLRLRGQEIANEINPATGSVYTSEVVAQKLKTFLDSGHIVRLEANEVPPANVASILGIQNEPCNPFDPNLQGDIVKLEKAKKNHARLCVVMTEAMVYRRPDVLHALEMQLPAVEALREQVNAVFQATGRWEKRIDYADTVAEIFIYLNDILSLGTNGYRYKLKGNRYDVVNQALLADDLKAVDSNLVLCTAFLADAPEDNAAKQDLINLLTIAKKDFDDALNDETMTAEEIQTLVTAADDLAKDVQDELDNLTHQLRDNPSQADALKHQSKVLERLKTVTAARMRTLQKIAKGL